MICNSDAHAKNISFLVNPLRQDGREREREVGMSVAPLYDLVCGKVYDYHDMAQTIGGESNFAVIGRKHWAQMANHCGVPVVLLQRLAASLLKRLEKALPSTAGRVMAETGSPMVSRIHELVRGQGNRLRRELASKVKNSGL